METLVGVLGTAWILFMALAIAGWWKVRELSRRNENQRKTIEAHEESYRDLEATRLQRNTAIRERDAVQADYDTLLQKLAQQALTATAPQPQNRRIRAGSWRQVRQASEDANRQAAENEEARERDTAFVEK